MFDKIKFLENYENETIKQYFELKKSYKTYSKKKEEKQQEFYNKVYIQNKKTDEIFTIKKTLKSETQKYKQLISLKVKELNRITKENNILEFFEEKRKKLWEEIKTIENKEELTEKRKILMLIKKKINNNEIEEIKELFKNF